jgi:predicted nucleic acid-binding protein
VSGSAALGAAPNFTALRRVSVPCTRVSRGPPPRGRPAARRNAHASDREDADLVTCGLIVSEILQGLRQARSLLNIERHFRQMDWLSPKEPATYLEAADLFRRLRERGITIRSTIDCVIACLATHHDALILSKDRDLTLIVESNLLVIRSMPVM